MQSLTPDTKVRFYHVPKSGGTTIFNLTQRWKNFKRAHPNKNHVPISYYPPKLDEIGIAVIRHPYSRFVSGFYHMVDACNPDFYYRWAKQSDCETLRDLGVGSFTDLYGNDPNNFLSALDNPNSPLHRTTNEIFSKFDIFKPQFYWLSDIFGMRVHHGLKIILNQENLQNEFNTVAQQLGQIPNWEGSQNVRISQGEVALTERSKDILRRIYNKDFRHFNFMESNVLDNNPYGIDNPAWGF